MSQARLFISYSGAESKDLALALADSLEAGPPSYSVWLDKRDLRPGEDWDEQISYALRDCRALIFLMTQDSVSPDSICKHEWSRALRHGKPVIPLRVNPSVDLPFRLSSRQYIDFSDFGVGLAQLRKHLAWMSTPEGILAETRIRLADARRELARANDGDRERLESRVDQLVAEAAGLEMLSVDRGPDSHLLGDNGGRSNPGLGPGSPHSPVPSPRENERSLYGDEPAELEDLHLLRLGLRNATGTDDVSLGAELVAGNIVLDSSICDYEGVALEKVETRSLGELDRHPRQPIFITSEKRLFPRPVPNRPKAHLVDWHAPVIDQGDVLTIDLARSDYWTSEATKRRIADLQRDLVEGRFSLVSLPRRFDVHLVLVTAQDHQVLLTRRGSHVATEPSTWMVSVGESMDWELDSGPSGLPHPLATARRCLMDRDELNIPASLANRASFRAIALATEWNEMLLNLVVTAWLPDCSFADVRRTFRRGENAAVDCVPYSLESCISLMTASNFSGSTVLGTPAPVSDISKMALLASLRHSYGVSALLREIENQA